jgi:hypothetical protein
MGYVGKPIIVASFTAAEGEYPLVSLTTDAAGDLFGAGEQGGAGGDGTVFEIAAAKGGAGAPATAAFVQAMASHGSNALASPSVSTTVWRDDPRTLLARPRVA